MKRLIIGNDFRHTVLRVLFLVVATWVVFGVCLQHIRLYGISMEPTLEEGGIRFVNKLAYQQRDPTRGDIVAARFKKGDRVLLLKRVIALPGESIAIRRGQTLIDGQILDEPYLHPDDARWNLAETTLGPREFYLIGDNRSMPIRDHAQGIVYRDQIIGKLIE